MSEGIDLLLELAASAGIPMRESRLRRAAR